jgi:hypothetical protein
MSILKLGNIDRLAPFLGRWKGHSVTKRSGVYGATIAEADTVVFLDRDVDGKLIQVIVLGIVLVVSLYSWWW